jgi:hypothetical protein
MEPHDARAAMLGERLLDVLPLVAAVGFAADVSQHVALCGTTWRRGDRGATNDMLVRSLERQCGARAARAAGREDFELLTVGAEMPDEHVFIIEGTTQLIRAALLNNLPRVQQLVQLGAPLGAVSEDEVYMFSALQWACRFGHERVATVLLDGKYEGCGPAVDLLAARRWTPLGLAGYYGREGIARLLLERGAKLELQDKCGETALHTAVRGDRSNVVEMLCAAPGATTALALRSDGGTTPLALAVLLQHDACVAVLRARGAPE